MSRVDFERLMGRHGVSAFDMDPDELADELALARALAGS